MVKNSFEQFQEKYQQGSDTPKYKKTKKRKSIYKSAAQEAIEDVLELDLSEIVDDNGNYIAPNDLEIVRRNAKIFAFLGFLIFAILTAIVLFTEVKDIIEPEKHDFRNNYNLSTPQKYQYYRPPLFPTVHQPYGPKEAYRRTNVEYIPYDKNESNLPKQDSEYLDQLFYITDFLVVERVQNYSSLYHNKPLRDIDNYNLAIEKITKLKPPKKAKKIHQLIREAIILQRDYFEVLSDGSTNFQREAPEVQAVYKKLVRAWKIMLKEYANESTQNRKSFEKHLAALDFI